jgi:NAD+ synthase
MVEYSELLTDIGPTPTECRRIQQNIEEFLKNMVSQKKADGVVFGLSGGIDSVTVAYLASKMFGKKALALVMPDSTVSPSSETGDALKVIGELGLDYKLIDIDVIHKIYSNRLEPDERALGNLRARIRANVIYYYANLKNYLVLGTSNKSEYLIGYFTKFGDGSADILPIVKLYKTQIRKLAEFVGVPSNIVTKRSSPNLWKGHDAEEEIGIGYEKIDTILHCMVDKNYTLDEFMDGVTGISKKDVEKIYQMYQNTQHKRILPERVESIYGDF